MEATSPTLLRPLGLLAELTHRCPLGCPYCSNPVALESRADELDTATWARVFAEAAGLGVLQVHLSGGEPAARRDLLEITAAARQAGLYTNLITSAVGLSAERLAGLAQAGLDHVQISIQDSEAASADRIAGYEGAFARKRALAAAVVQQGLPLTVNAVVHRANIDRIDAMVDQAVALGASRVEIAHVQYYGWAIPNRAMLMPTPEQVERAREAVEALRDRHQGIIVIDAVVPDYYARYPKPCVGGWGRPSLNVTPSGKVLPCHAAESISGHGLDAGALRELSAAVRGFWRVPVPGVCAPGRRACDRSGLPSLPQPWSFGRACRRATRCPLCVSTARWQARCKCFDTRKGVCGHRGGGYHLAK